MSAKNLAIQDVPAVGVVIVNYNLKDSLRETLRSFEQVTYPKFTVLVSDNASKDGSQEMVHTEFPKVRLLAHATEQGYAKAASLGMAALADDHKYIFSTTNDVIVDPQILNVLVEFAEQDPKGGVWGIRIYFFSRPEVLWHAGGRVNPLHGHLFHIGYVRRDHPRYAKVRDCDFVTGCGFLLRSEVAKRVGFLDPELVFYAEDADLCYKVRAEGYAIRYVPAARMWHKVDSTLAKNRPLQLRYGTRNGLYLLQRHRAGWHPFTLWAYIFITSPLKMALFVLMGHWKNARGIYRGIQDWRQGKLGWIRED